MASNMYRVGGELGRENGGENVCVLYVCVCWWWEREERRGKGSTCIPLYAGQLFTNLLTTRIQLFLFISLRFSCIFPTPVVFSPCVCVCEGGRGCVYVCVYVWGCFAVYVCVGVCDRGEGGGVKMG